MFTFNQHFISGVVGISSKEAKTKQYLDGKMFFQDLPCVQLVMSYDDVVHIKNY